MYKCSDIYKSTEAETRPPHCQQRFVRNIVMFRGCFISLKLVLEVVLVEHLMHLVPQIKYQRSNGFGGAASSDSTNMEEKTSDKWGTRCIYDRR